MSKKNKFAVVVPFILFLLFCGFMWYIIKPLGEANLAYANEESIIVTNGEIDSWTVDGVWYIWDIGINDIELKVVHDGGATLVDHIVSGYLLYYKGEVYRVKRISSSQLLLELDKEG